MKDPAQKKSYGPEEAREKIKNFCVYRERSHFEVREKLYEYGLYTDAVNLIISELIQENYLNEERFAQAFVRGKFNIKKWGRNKIRQALFRHKLSDYVLSKAFAEIDDNKYLQALENVLETKSRQLKIKNDFERRGKVARYAISRGFEPDLVWEKIAELNI